MSKNRLLHVFVLFVLIIASSSSVMGKNPVLKGTKWTAVQEMFVADAGTMTITHTLEFISAKKVRVSEKSDLPPYPAMYRNPDGTVDTMPGISSESEYVGTYQIKFGFLIITKENGHKESFHYMEDGTFTQKTPWDEVIVYTRNEEE